MSAVLNQRDAAPKLKVTILGSGTSQGVPMIGCNCPVCLSPDPRDKRTRCSIVIQTPAASILVDTPPDLRMQALRENLTRVDIVLMTHHHADHLMGFDDLRRFCDILGTDLPVYASETTLSAIKKIFPYAFLNPPIAGYVRVQGIVVSDKPFEYGGLQITPLPVLHGRLTNTAYLFTRNGRKLFAYLTDCNSIPPAVLELIRGVEVLVIDGVREKAHTTHFNVEGAVAASREIGALQSYLTHQAHDKTHAQRTSEMPERIGVAYDGQVIELPWD